MAPNWGGHLAVDGDLVTVSGAATNDVVSLTWSNGTDGGTVAVEAAWTAADVPLVPGDNTLTFTATDADGNVDEEVLWVTSTPGVPLASGLTLSVPLVEVGMSLAVRADVQTNGDVDGVEVGPADSSGALTEVWGSLSDADGDGVWSGDLTVPTDDVASYSLRAVAAVGSTTGATPPVDFEVLAPLSDTELDALDALAEAVNSAMDGVEDPVERAEAAVQALLKDDDVEAVLMDSTGEVVEYVALGVPHILYEPQAGSMGAESEVLSEGPGEASFAGAPPPARSTVSPVALLRAQTVSSSGVAGPPPPPTVAPAVTTIATVSPFPDHFSGNYDADGDGTADRVIPLEVAEFLPLLVEGRQIECPVLETTARYGIDDPAEATLDVVQAALDAGVAHISTHGIVSSFYGRGRRGPRRGVLATRQGWSTSALSEDDLLHFRAGHIIRMTAHGEPVLAFDGNWVRGTRSGDYRLEDAIVGLTACNSGTTTEPIASFLQAGASLAYGFNGSVDAVDGLDIDVSFFRRLLEREESNLILQEAGATWPKRGGTLVWQGQSDVYLGDSRRIQNGSFETVTVPSADPDHWTTISALGTDFYAFVATDYLSTTPTDGSNLLYMFTYDGDPAYNEIGQNVCPAPGRLMRLTFDWQVRTDEWASCSSTGVPNWVNVRIQAPDIDSEVLWHKAWADVCPMLTDTGEWDQKSTGWQQAEVFFEAPETFEPDDERLVFTVGGYNASAWFGIYDNVKLEPVP